MPKKQDWEFPATVQPKSEDVAFDLKKALSAVVGLRAEVPEDAFTADTLGTERDGNGVVIGTGGLVLTIGYLVTEAEAIWLTTNSGTAVPGHVVGYDQPTGFGLVQALGQLDVPPLVRGSSRGLSPGDPVIFAGHGGRRHAVKAQVVAKREFAGYWEYLLDEAIFTAPAHPHWGGAALIGMDGKLLGIGSLLVQEGEGEADGQGNMIVPIDLLEPILDKLLKYGRADLPPRPWLGMYTMESQEGLVVANLARGGPASRAQVKAGDRVVEVAGEPVEGLASLFRRIWSLGPAGTDIPLTLAREGDTFEVRIRSADRNDFLKKPHLH
ncbi:MAG TPA: S1C family serine protease [Alphaproteobacteria bacterium]|nr:S1C family serine protease [Alphaproteobacteria bacterium]